MRAKISNSTGLSWGCRDVTVNCSGGGNEVMTRTTTGGLSKAMLKLLVCVQTIQSDLCRQPFVNTVPLLLTGVLL